MLPNNVIANVPRKARFLYPDSEEVDPLVSYELGGTALNDPTGGLMVKIWTGRIDGQDIKLSAQGIPEFTLLTITGVLTSVSLAFDSNMQPTVAYIADGAVKLYWFDTVAGTFVTTDFGAVAGAKVSTDDKRASQTAARDVILGYVKNNVLYWRQQRDRYTVERVAGPTFGYTLRRIGMNEKRCFQFELTGYKYNL